MTLTVQAAKEAEKNPAAQAAARTIGQAVGAVYTVSYTHLTLPTILLV